MKCLMAESRRDIRWSWIISIMRKSVGQRIQEKEIVKQKFDRALWTRETPRPKSKKVQPRKLGAIPVCRTTNESLLLHHQGEIPGGIFMPGRRWFSWSRCFICPATSKASSQTRRKVRHQLHYFSEYAFWGQNDFKYDYDERYPDESDVRLIIYMS